MDRERVLAEARAHLERLRGVDGETRELPSLHAEPAPMLIDYEVPDALTVFRAEQDAIARDRRAFKRELRRQEEQQTIEAAAQAAAERDMDEIPQIIIDAVGGALAEERKRHREERDKALEPLFRELAELRGQVSALIAILGNGSSSSKADIVPLPTLPRRSGAA
jgi:hypothetical protein